MQSRDCQPTDGTELFGIQRELSGDGFDIYVGLVAACMAAFRGGGPKAWETAEKVLDSPARAQFCLDAPVRALLHRLIKAHRAAPSLPFVADTGPGAGAPTACPHIRKITIDTTPSGPMVTIEGENLASVSRVEVIDDMWQQIGDRATPTQPDHGSIQAILPELRTDAGTKARIGIVDPNDGLIDSGTVRP